MIAGTHDEPSTPRRCAGRRRLGHLRPSSWISPRRPRCEIVAIADPQTELARAAAARFAIPTVAPDHRALIERDDIDLIDVCTPSHTHFELAWAALEAGKHVLCEKPVAYDFRDTRRAAALAREKGLKTKLGFTFRYAPAMRYMRELVAQGFIGQPFIFNGFEQNSQWLDPQNTAPAGDPPGRSVGPAGLLARRLRRADHRHRAPAGRRRSVGRRRDHAELHPRARGARHRADDAHEHRRWRHLHGRVRQRRAVLDPDQLRDGRQLPRHRGADLRVEGALICRLVEEGGICERLWSATPDQVEFRELPVPERFYPPGGSREESWRSLFYANLVSSFIGEILRRRRRATKATSTMGRGCRRRSTPSRRRTGNGDG